MRPPAAAQCEPSTVHTNLTFSKHLTLYDASCLNFLCLWMLLTRLATESCVHTHWRLELQQKHTLFSASRTHLSAATSSSSRSFHHVGGNKSRKRDRECWSAQAYSVLLRGTASLSAQPCSTRACPAAAASSCADHTTQQASGGKTASFGARIFCRSHLSVKVLLTVLQLCSIPVWGMLQLLCAGGMQFSWVCLPNQNIVIKYTGRNYNHAVNFNVRCTGNCSTAAVYCLTGAGQRTGLRFARVSPGSCCRFCAASRHYSAEARTFLCNCCTAFGCLWLSSTHSARGLNSILFETHDLSCRQHTQPLQSLPSQTQRRWIR